MFSPRRANVHVADNAQQQDPKMNELIVVEEIVQLKILSKTDGRDKLAIKELHLPVGFMPQKLSENRREGNR